MLLDYMVNLAILGELSQIFRVSTRQIHGKCVILLENFTHIEILCLRMLESLKTKKADMERQLGLI